MKSGDRTAATEAGKGAPRMLVVDLDAVAFDEEREREALGRLLRRRRRDALLVYVTGRSAHGLLPLLEEWEHFPVADYHVTSLGTEIYRGSEQSRVWGWDRVVRKAWHRDSIAKAIFKHHPGLSLESEARQGSYRISFAARSGSLELARQVEQELTAAKHPCRVLFQPPEALDVVPAPAGVGSALKWLVDSLAIPVAHAAVVTRGTNSAEFLERGFRLIVVFEPSAERAASPPPPGVSVALRPGAAGIGDSLRDLELLRTSESAPALIDVAFQKALEALRKNITPLGFSAASLADLKVEGTTAENYRSVWARDGMITLIWTLDLDDADIRACARQTLITLLDHQTPTGLLPINVRIDTGLPEYSGLGEIASIDSGLWVLIGACRYLEVTGDVATIASRLNGLQKAMDWLAAQDVNNCGLLEIPELGDWADLMGRSYNVLYDEVLWHTALNSYARMLRILGDPGRAAPYEAMAAKAKAKILELFWPGRRGPQDAAQSFTQTQNTIGSVSYLLAQITPFSFNWRCDVYGNLLAALDGILDEARCEKLFRFLWGVGVNEPWPVRCLYPPLDAGAPDWKAYLIVNMLNLPHHYHNGGIWPFIGGLWVRFLHKLGRVELAHRELRRLAELNKLGTDREWEFNEWAHGRTGRPMGMAYQAWSAASYIQAYLALKRDPQSAGATEEPEPPAG